MVVPVEVRGADDFLRAARAMRDAGRGDLLKEMQKALRKAPKTITQQSRQRALSSLPSSGGLAQRVARAPQRVTARAGNTTAKVVLRVGKKGSGARGADDGLVRHPVFGNRRAFVGQRVTPGWFTQTARNQAPQVRREVTDTLADYAARLAASMD